MHIQDNKKEFTDEEKQIAEEITQSTIGAIIQNVPPGMYSTVLNGISISLQASLKEKIEKQKAEMHKLLEAHDQLLQG